MSWRGWRIYRIVLYISTLTRRTSGCGCQGILIPDNPDHLLGLSRCSYTYFEEAAISQACGSLTIRMVDRDLSTVGTANFDNRSFRLNFEITAIVADAAFAKVIEMMLENNFAHVKEIHMSEIEENRGGSKLATPISLTHLTGAIILYSDLRRGGTNYVIRKTR